MLTRDEYISRRCARMEALASDLAGLPPGYQPTELEVKRAQALYDALGQFLGVVVPELGGAEGPAPEAEAKPAPAPKSGKK
jgi:hypothetical protein